MPTPTRAPLRVIGLALGLFLSLLPQASADLHSKLPADNPYAAAFAALSRLSPDDKEALVSGKPASPAAVPLLAEINRALDAGRQSRSVDWGIDYEHFDFSTIIPGISESAAISKIVLSEAESHSAPNLVDRTLGTLALARHLGKDTPLISLLTQWALEARTNDWLRSNFPRLSQQDAVRLLTGLDRLPSGGDLATALAVEKMMFVDRMTVELRQVIQTLGETSSAPDNFASQLRLAGIVTDGPVISVGLEKEGLSFWLKPGENKHGITLLHVDRSRDEALLACNGRMARVQLSSHKIAQIDCSRLAEAVKALPHGNLLHTLMPHQTEEADGETFIRNTEQAAREMGDLYAEAIAHPEDFADTDAYLERIKKLSPQAQNIAEWLPRAILMEKKATAMRDKLRADLSAIATTTRP